VCDLFRGQETCRTEFTVTRDATAPNTPSLFRERLGHRQPLHLLDDEILANLATFNCATGCDLCFVGLWRLTVEMETGTGKTYVYLRTIFELNRRYGFTKVCDRGTVGR